MLSIAVNLAIIFYTSAETNIWAFEQGWVNVYDNLLSVSI